MPKILIVDDEHQDSAFQTLKTHLESAGYQVEFFPYNCCNNPGEEFKKLKEEVLSRIDIDIILLDLMYEGVKIDTEIIDDFSGSGIPVIIFTLGRADREFIWKLSRYGDVEFWERTLQDDGIQKLINLIKEILGNVNARFNKENLFKDNKYAETYDYEELKSAGTLSAIIWENNRLLNCLSRLLKPHDTMDRSKKINILDIGCGTGRFEEVILKSEFADQIEMIFAVDYAPEMVTRTVKRMAEYPQYASRIKVKRRIAENLRLPDDQKFDLIIMGFGVPSFVKYETAINEIKKHLVPEGLCMFTCYNYDAFYYELIKRDGKPPISALIDRDRGIIGPKPYEIDCNTFKSVFFSEFLKSMQFNIVETKTFPTLYSSLPTSLVTIPKAKNKDKTNTELISYENKYLELDPLGSGFDIRLHLADLEFSSLHDGTGYYLNVIARKPAWVM